MTWTIRDVDPKDPDWAGFVECNEHLIFHEPAWSSVLDTGVSDESCAFIIYNNDKPTCGSLGVVVKAPGVRIGYFSYPYGGLIGTPPPAETLAMLLRQLGKQRRFAQIQLVGYPYETEQDHTGFKADADQTNILPIVGLTPESLMQSYKRVRRQEINRAFKRGVTISVRDDAQSIARLYGYYLDTMSRTGGIARYKPELIEAIVKNYSASGRARLSIAEANGDPIGAMLVVDSEKLSHGLVLVSSAEGRKFEANKVLLHTAVEDAVREGKEGFDFMPSGQSGKGVSQFKSMWHTDEVPLTHRTLVVKPFRALAWRTMLGAAKKWPMRNVLAYTRSRSR
jgi:hypothetical protein